VAGTLLHISCKHCTATEGGAAHRLGDGLSDVQQFVWLLLSCFVPGAVGGWPLLMKEQRSHALLRGGYCYRMTCPFASIVLLVPGCTWASQSSGSLNPRAGAMTAGLHGVRDELRGGRRQGTATDCREHAMSA
jgi:hypothetical protein